MNRPSHPYVFRSGEQSAPRFVVGDRADLARVAHEAAELPFSGGRRRYVEHFVGHFAVRGAAFLLDASVETTILGGVGVDRVVLSRSEDDVIGLAMIACSESLTVATEDSAEGAVKDMSRTPLSTLNTLTV